MCVAGRANPAPARACCWLPARTGLCRWSGGWGGWLPVPASHHPSCPCRPTHPPTPPPTAGMLQVVDCSRGVVQATLAGHGNPINDVAVHPTRVRERVGCVVYCAFDLGVGVGAGRGGEGPCPMLFTHTHTLTLDTHHPTPHHPTPHHPLAQPHLVATASRDQSVRVWSLAGGGCCVLVLQGAGGHRNEVLSVDWSPWGETLVTGEAGRGGRRGGRGGGLRGEMPWAGEGAAGRSRSLALAPPL